MTGRRLQVFLCHASQDKPAARQLYQKLLSIDWIEPWLDEEKLLPGQDWNIEIEKAMDKAEVILVCISPHSVSKEGYVQKEIKKALDKADEKPEDTIFIIPVRLEECNSPSRLSRWQWVDLFRTQGYEMLTQGLRKRFDNLPKNEKMNSDNRTRFEVSKNAIATLFILQSDDPVIVGQTFEIVKKYTTVGRKANNDIIFAKDSPVSRQHAAIEFRDGKFYICELFSESIATDGKTTLPVYGTFVNNEQIIKSAQLNNGDEISLGKRVRIRFEIMSE